MNPKPDNLIAMKYRGFTRKIFTNLLSKTDDERSILLEENRTECRKRCKCFKCLAVEAD